MSRERAEKIVSNLHRTISRLKGMEVVESEHFPSGRAKPDVLERKMHQIMKKYGIKSVDCI
tara:strand:+ start:796 stop:978 length:183 start_codon:yes stop_codon:yes gene_type:complete